MASAMTRDEFSDMLCNGPTCCVYFLDKDERMHFVANYEFMATSISVREPIRVFCDSISNAFIGTEHEAHVLKLLCQTSYPSKTFHIVKIANRLEWA